VAIPKRASKNPVVRFNPCLSPLNVVKLLKVHHGLDEKLLSTEAVEAGMIFIK
jgi:hypothetical protein